jgi:hypothetical protein
MAAPRPVSTRGGAVTGSREYRGVKMNWTIAPSRNRVRAGLLFLAIVSVACATRSTLPGHSRADVALQRAASRAVLSADVLEPPACASGTIVYTEVVTPPTTPEPSPWVERWTVEHCGQRLAYLLTFTPDVGGTTFRLKTER